MIREAAVIGSPVSHSRSPAIFSFLAERLGVPSLRYVARELHASGLEGFLTEVRGSPSWAGFNVTLPHKESIVARLDQVSDEARTIGAVNAVQVRDGLTGHNTDVIGVLRTLDEHRCSLRGRDCLIWGAGGAAHAVAYALGKRGARTVFVRNRGPAAAEALAARFAAVFPRTVYAPTRDQGPQNEDENEDERARRPPLSLVVNATPVGMTGYAGPADASFFSAMQSLPLTRDALAFDLVYDPERTPFLVAAEERDMRIAGGLEMLVEQALATWELWFAPIAEREELREALREHLRPPPDATHESCPIFLTGFMGVGKSAVGALLAERLGWGFVDTDRQVEDRAGRTIRELFAAEGEPAFRSLEKQAVAEAAARSRVVVALGGGALLDPETEALVERAGRLVHLSAELETIETRLSTDGTRPLLAGMASRERRERITAMLVARAPHYRRAELQVSTDGHMPAEIADQVIARLRTAARRRM